MSDSGEDTATEFRDRRYRDAVISDDGRYRYRLSRGWNGDRGGTVVFLMLNPSTADASEDDPTIRRCINFAQNWGFGELVVGNLFAYRATDPSELEAAEDAIGPENDDYLREMVADADRVVAAWGARGGLKGRGREVAGMLDAELLAVDTTKEGHPAHPLYQPADAELKKFGYD